MEIYKGYLIETNRPAGSVCLFRFFNMGDCCGSVCYGEDLEDCKKKIDQLIK